MGNGFLGFNNANDKSFNSSFGDTTYVAGIDGVDVGNGDTKFRNYIYKDFVGINFDGVKQLDTDITKLVTSVKNTVSEFGVDAFVEKGLKGKTLDDAIAYVGAVKAVLNAYIESLNQIKVVAQTAISVMADNDSRTEANVASASQSIQSIASNIETEAEKAASAIDVDTLNYGNQNAGGGLSTGIEGNTPNVLN